MAEELRFASKEDVLSAIDDVFHNESDLDESGITVVYEARDDEMGCTIRLIGEVGTEAQLQVAEQLVTDVLGLPDIDNRLHVNESLRDEHPGTDKPVRLEEDTDYMGETLEAIDGGVVDEEFGWSPPDHPIPETTRSYDREHPKHRDEYE